jgi:dethiobiotin synthetase
VALKPFETGVQGLARDAAALATACGQPELIDPPGLFRAQLPLAPYAASLETNSPPPDFGALVQRTRALTQAAEVVVIEGAGGLLVPIDATRDIADFARALELPVVLVAADRLGVLSSVLACVACAQQRQLRVAAVVLSDHSRAASDPSPNTNRRILQQRLDFPVLAFPHCEDDDDQLADAAEACGILRALEGL